MKKSTKGYDTRSTDLGQTKEACRKAREREKLRIKISERLKKRRTENTTKGYDTRSTDLGRLKSLFGGPVEETCLRAGEGEVGGEALGRDRRT
jgi:hypothetical protein